MIGSAGTILFLVPARGGSKGVPRKNLAMLAGQPLIVHVLQTAKAAMRMCHRPGSRLIVSTDDEEIALTARQWGAEVPFLRPAELAQDASPTIDTVLHVLDALHMRESYEPGVVVLLQPTSPLVGVEDVCNAVQLFWESGSPVVSVTQNEHPLEWSFYLADGCLRPITASPDITRRQAARDTYRLNGAVFLASPEQLRRGRSFLLPETRGYVMPSERSIDIDTGLDLQVTEAVLARQAVSAPQSVIAVAGRKIGPSHPCFIVAEAGVNHNGDIKLAYELIDAATQAGADAVKFQTFRAEEIVTASAPKAAYQKATTDAAESQLDMLKRLELSQESHYALKRYAEERELIFLSTPFEPTSADFLESLDVVAFKLPSGEVTNTPFLAHVARKGRPILLSTGMSTLEEVSEAVRIIRAHGNPPLALFHCVSCYPAVPEDCNLRAMEALRCAFHVPVGFSDHSMGLAVPVTAVALGANLIEKHLTLDRRLPGPDHAASLEPAEFTAMIEAIRTAEAALGQGVKRPTTGELETARVARKSLTAICDIRAGTVLTADMIAMRRPGTGLPPTALEQVVGRQVRRHVRAGDVLSWEDVDEA